MAWVEGSPYSASTRVSSLTTGGEGGRGSFSTSFITWPTYITTWDRREEQASVWSICHFSHLIGAKCYTLSRSAHLNELWWWKIIYIFSVCQEPLQYNSAATLSHWKIVGFIQHRYNIYRNIYYIYFAWIQLHYLHSEIPERTTARHCSVLVEAKQKLKMEEDDNKVMSRGSIILIRQCSRSNYTL